MLLVLLRCEGESYGIDAKQIVEVVPFAALSLNEDLQNCCGILMRYGKKVFVVDFTQLTSFRPSKVFFSTRIIIVNLGSEGSYQHIGILAEGVTQTLKLTQPGNILDTGLLKFAKQTIVVNERRIHLIDLQQLSDLLSNANLTQKSITSPLAAATRHD